MLISVINLSKRPDGEVQRVIRAVNRQLREDFAPAWDMTATLRLEGHTGRLPSKQRIPDMRGDAVLYLWDKADVEDALGYHSNNFPSIPYGIVPIRVSGS